MIDSQRPAACRRQVRVSVSLAIAVMVSGCATSREERSVQTGQTVQMSDRSIRGAKVLVTCQAPDAPLAQICEEHFVRLLQQAGVLASRPSRPIDTQAGNEAALRAARADGASAIVSSRVSLSAAPVQTLTPAVGGSFGFGRGVWGPGMGVSAGFTVPLPAGPQNTALAAGTVVIDAISGQQIWAFRSGQNGQDEPSVQAAALAGAAVDAMGRGGLLESR